jgi:putative transposase
MEMDEDYLLATVRYVERNPVAAKLCKFPEDWKWSSARAHIKGEDDALVRVRPMLDRVDRWRDCLSATGNSNEGELIEQHARTGRPLGSSDFVRWLEIITGENLAPKSPAASHQ